jgi:16S rRNA (guanine527-N7)-methyltransferase
MPVTRLNQLLSESGAPPLDPETAEKFAAYLTLLQKWNTRTNLTAIRDEEGILSRHFVESILCAHKLPKNISFLLDFGSGAGFPGLPIALIRKEISVTLAESQNKKAAFLREAVRTLDLNTKVHSARAETLQSTFDCITLRAVDNMAQAIPAAIQLLSPTGWLAIMTTTEDSSSIQTQANQSTPPSSSLTWHPLLPLPEGTNRVLLLAQKFKIPIQPINIAVQAQ